MLITQAGPNKGDGAQANEGSYLIFAEGPFADDRQVLKAGYRRRAATLNWLRRDRPND